MLSSVYHRLSVSLISTMNKPLMSRQINMLNIRSYNIDLHYKTWIIVQHISFGGHYLLCISFTVIQSHNKGNVGEDNRRMTCHKSSRFRCKTVFTVCECPTFMFPECWFCSSGFCIQSLKKSPGWVMKHFWHCKSNIQMNRISFPGFPYLDDWG